MERLEINIITGEQQVIPLTQIEIDEIIARQPTKTQLKNKAIQERTLLYKSDLSDLQWGWISASVSDGVNEETKKTLIMSDITALKTEYDNDIAAIRLQYT